MLQCWFHCKTIQTNFQYMFCAKPTNEFSNKMSSIVIFVVSHTPLSMAGVLWLYESSGFTNPPAFQNKNIKNIKVNGLKLSKTELLTKKSISKRIKFWTKCQLKFYLFWCFLSIFWKIRTTPTIVAGDGRNFFLWN